VLVLVLDFFAAASRPRTTTTTRTIKKAGVFP
jgi:hypothetical protein